MELIEYAEKNNLEWNEDETNNKLVHERNLIRLNVLPELRKITPNIEKVFVRESQIFAGITDYLNKEVYEKAMKKEILLKEFLQLPFILQTELLREISRDIPSMSEVEDCLKWIQNNPQGGSKKTIGRIGLKLDKGVLKWE